MLHFCSNSTRVQDMHASVLPQPICDFNFRLDHNPGGLMCCGGGTFLLDADQQVPAPVDTFQVRVTTTYAAVQMSAGPQNCLFRRMRRTPMHDVQPSKTFPQQYASSSIAFISKNTTTSPMPTAYGGPLRCVRSAGQRVILPYAISHACQLILTTLISPQATNNEYDCPKSTADCLNPATNASLCTHVIRSVFRGRDMLKPGAGRYNQRCYMAEAVIC